MRAPIVFLFFSASVQLASCFFPLFFPGPIIYPKTTEAPTTPEPKKVVHRSYQTHRHSYHPHASRYPIGGYHHIVEYDEGYEVEEHTEEVTEPPTTTTTTTTTTPKPPVHHYQRVVYPRPPPLHYPHAPYPHRFGGYRGHPVPPPFVVPHPYHGPPHPPQSHYARTPAIRVVPEPADGSEEEEDDPAPPPPPPPPKMKKKKEKPTTTTTTTTTTTPPPDPDSMESMDEVTKAAPKRPYRPVYASGARRRPPSGYPYPDQYQNPKLRRPPPTYKSGPPRQPYQPPVRQNRPPANLPPEEPVDMEMVELDAREINSPEPPFYRSSPLRQAYQPPVRQNRPPAAPPAYQPPEDPVDMEMVELDAREIHTPAPPFYKSSPLRQSYLPPAKPSRPQTARPAYLPLEQAFESEMREANTPPPPPAFPPKTRRPVIYVTLSTTSAPEATAAPPPLPPSKYYLPPGDSADVDFGSDDPNVNAAVSNRRSDDARDNYAFNIEQPERQAGSNFEHWNRRDTIFSPHLESTSFDTLSYDFIREMIANGTMAALEERERRNL